MLRHIQQLRPMERSTIIVFLYMMNVHRTTSPSVHLIRKSTVITTIRVVKKGNPEMNVKQSNGD